jgi:hypothetical protein
MCTKSNDSELRNCHCKLAQFCKRRQQLISEEKDYKIANVLYRKTESGKQTQSTWAASANPVKGLMTK